MSTPGDHALELIRLRAEGLASEAEQRELESLLRDDAALREVYVDYLLLDAALMSRGREGAGAQVVEDAGVERKVLPMPKSRVIRQPWMLAMERSMRSSSRDRLLMLESAAKPKVLPFAAWRPLALAAGIALLGLLGWFWHRDAASLPDGPAVVQVGQISGSLHWREDARDYEIAESGTGLPAGTFSLLDDLDCCELVFADGTRLSLRGPAVLEISDDGQKRLRLRSGTFAADVVPQPEGRPMIVRTSTSESIVLGTRFELSASGDRSALAVDHGLVRFRRLADNASVEVAPQQIAEAAADGEGRLESRTQAAAPRHWRSELSRPPGPRWRGDWLEAEGALPPRVAAVPRPLKKSEGVHYRVAAENEIGPLAAVTPESVARIRYRLRDPVARLEVFINTHRASGGFGGNYSTFIRPPAATPDADGWLLAEVPFASMKPVLARFKPLTDDALLQFIYLSSWEHDAGLEVAGMEVFTP